MSTKLCYTILSLRVRKFSSHLMNPLRLLVTRFPLIKLHFSLQYDDSNDARHQEQIVFEAKTRSQVPAIIKMVSVTTLSNEQNETRTH